MGDDTFYPCRIHAGDRITHDIKVYTKGVYNPELSHISIANKYGAVLNFFNYGDYLWDREGRLVILHDSFDGDTIWEVEDSIFNPMIMEPRNQDAKRIKRLLDDFESLRGNICNKKGAGA